MSAIVSNASPLIILAKAELLDVLQLLYKEIRVPLAVVEEIKEGQVKDPVCQLIDSISWIHKVTITSPLRFSGHMRLGKGEAEVIEYALQNKETCALLDDRAARKAAQALGIPVYGTLSILAQASLLDHSLSFDHLIDQVIKAGIYLKQETVEKVKQSLKEYKKPV